MFLPLRCRLLSLFVLMGINAWSQQNTLLIIADDVSPDYFGMFSSATDTAITPNLRTLSNRGIRFTKVWAAPVCSPTRAGIFTGRYPFRTGVGQVITNATTPQLDTGEVSIAELLHDKAPQKYHTACAGKWHLHVNTPAKRLNPNRMGFDFYSGNFNGAITDYFNYPIIVNGQLDTATTYATTQTVNDAISWLDTISSAKPFFLWVAFNAPHSPYHLPPANLCDTTGLPGTTAHINANKEKYFKAAIQAMDTEIGRLFQYLTTNNLMDSTHIIFIGDNGNGSDVAQIATPNRAKGTIYDYGVRVPMIVAGPAVVNPNRSSDALLNTPDLFATIAELCGFTNWKNFIPQDTVIDSKSFLPIIRNQSTSTRSWIFTEQFQVNTVASDGKTIRDEDYQLLRFNNGSEQFYNQSSDPEENNNLLTATMTSADVQHYHFLCDSLNALLGTGSCLPLSSAEVGEGPALTIYPNPGSSQIWIQSNEPISGISLFDLCGRTLMHTTERSLHLSALSGGIYWIRVQFVTGQSRTEKIRVNP